MGFIRGGTFSPLNSMLFNLFSGLVLFLWQNLFDFAKDNVLGRGYFEPVD